MNLLGQPIRVGDLVHADRHRVTAEVRDFYLGTFHDANPLYASPGPSGGAPIAPSLLHHSEVYRHVERWYLRNLVGNLHARQEWQLFAPLLVDSELVTRSTVVERYRRRDRDYVVNEVDYCDAAGRLLVRGRTHQSFLAAKSDAESGFVVDRGTAREKERKPVGSAPGPELEAVELAVDRTVCWRFSGPGRNYHTDPDEARKLGFPDIVVQGMLSTCLVDQLMARAFGEGWVRGGRMDVKLVNVLWAGEKVRARGKRLDESAEGSARRVSYEVWVEKDDPERTVVTVGTASALA
jgi:acyl dehydratase